MLNTLNINLKTDIKNDRATTLPIKLMSQDKNNNQFILRFTNGGEPVSLDDTYTVEILTKFSNSGASRLTSATVRQDYATWQFDTEYITQDEMVYNYVYVRKAGNLVVSADANAFYFDVGLSEIDKDASRVAEVYDENYQKYLDEFKENVDFEEIAQAEQARKEAELLREENYTQKVDTAIVEADVVSKVDSKVTELTPQITNLTAQLAQKASISELSKTNTEVSGLDQRIDNLIIPISPENSNIEVTNALTSVTKGKTFSTLSNRFEESEKEVLEIKETELQDNMLIFELPNEVKNSVVGDILNKNVAQHTIQETDILGVADGENISLIRIAKPSDYVGFGNTSNEHHDSGYHEFGMNFRAISNAYDDVAHIGKMIMNQSNNQIWYIIERGSMTLSQAKDYFVGSKFWYQLASPVQVPLKMSPKVKKVINIDKKIDELSTGVGLDDNSITSNKRTNLGEMAIVTVSSTGTLPNLDTVQNKLVFSSNFFIFNRDERYTITPRTFDYLELNNDSTGVLIYFDTLTSEFHYRLQNAITGVTESSILFAVVYKVSGKWYLKMNCEYTVDGMVPGGEKPQEAEKGYSFAPDNLSGFYKTPEGSYPAINTATEMINAFRDLAAAHSEYVTETLMGYDSSGEYPIYQYRLNPGGATIAGLTKGYPSIALVAGQHGCERAAVYGTYYMLKELLENWQSDPILEYLRWNFVFTVIPLVNPWGFDEGDGFTGDPNLGRLNSNGVDINRNYSVNWEAGNTHGSEPFSEVETQYVKRMIDESGNAIYFGDFHTNNSTGDIYNNLLWISMTADNFYNEDIAIAAKYLIEKQSRDFIGHYELPFENYPFGYATANNVGGGAKMYASSKGIPSSTIECFRKFPTEETYYSDNTVKGCTEFVTNFMVSIIRQFKSKY